MFVDDQVSTTRYIESVVITCYTIGQSNNTRMKQTNLFIIIFYESSQEHQC